MKIQITRKQAQQFNAMRAILQRIKCYQTTDQLAKNSERDYGLRYEEALEMSYENMQHESTLIKGVREIKIPICAPVKWKKYKSNPNIL